jgi:hypothetical protein
VVQNGFKSPENERAGVKTKKYRRVWRHIPSFSIFEEEIKFRKKLRGVESF